MYTDEKYLLREFQSINQKKKRKRKKKKKKKKKKKRENSTRVAMEGGNMTDVGKLRSTTIQRWVQLLSATVWNKSETTITTITTKTFFFSFFLV